MSNKKTDYHQLYDRLLTEVNAMYIANLRRLRRGAVLLLLNPVLFIIFYLIAGGSKAFILILWIISLFIIAGYMILIDYLNHLLKKRVEKITNMEQAQLTKDALPTTLENVKSNIKPVIDSIKEHDKEVNAALAENYRKSNYNKTADEKGTDNTKDLENDIPKPFINPIYFQNEEKNKK